MYTFVYVCAMYVRIFVCVYAYLLWYVVVYVMYCVVVCCGLMWCVLVRSRMVLCGLVWRFFCARCACCGVFCEVVLCGVMVLYMVPVVFGLNRLLYGVCGVW